MKILARAGVVALALSLLPAVSSAAGRAADGAYVGEVRAIAVARGNHDATVQLHKDGWIEAAGELLPIAKYPALYRQIGRAWTADGVTEDLFAVPRLRDTMLRVVSSDNPYGVLGPSDLVHSGVTPAPASRPSPISYWIFVGADETSVNPSANR